MSYTRISMGLKKDLDALLAKMPSMDVELILLSRLVRLLNCNVSSQLNECLRQHGLSESLWLALLAIYAQPEHKILPSKLSEVLSLTRTSATRLSDELVHHGWVERYNHPSDRRKVTLQLTDKGEQLILSVSPHTNATRHRMWSVLDADERATLQQLLNKLLAQESSP